jgi:hypothetical protein
MKTHSTTPEPLAENPQAVAVAKLALAAVAGALQVAFYRKGNKALRDAGINSPSDLAGFLGAATTAMLEEAMRDTNVYRINGGPVAQVTERRARAAADARLILAALDDLPDGVSPFYGAALKHIKDKEGDA